jgi:hypothetical protein
VKLDISFVHDVDKDADKQALIQNLISYARRGAFPYWRRAWRRATNCAR